MRNIFIFHYFQGQIKLQHNSDFGREKLLEEVVDGTDSEELEDGADQNSLKNVMAASRNTSVDIV
jgi:hypothetical protein